MQKSEMRGNGLGTQAAVWLELRDEHSAGGRGKGRPMVDLCMQEAVCPTGGVLPPAPGATAAEALRWVPGTGILRSEARVESRGAPDYECLGSMS